MSEPGLKRVETGVDQLVKFLQGRGMIDMKEAASKLGMPLDVIQSWVDFLVEEEIVGIEYKFTKPYIYIMDKTPGRVSKQLSNYKKRFEDAVKKNEMPETKTNFLWKSHLLNELEKQKEFFYQQANLRNLDNPDQLWDEYKKRVGT